MKLAQALLFVADVDRMVAFYGGLLGLPVIAREPGFVRLDAGGTVLALHALPAHVAGPVADPPVARTDTAHKLCFHADDVDGERARLVAAGIAMRDIHRFGNVVLCDGIDPEGNVFQITTR